MYLLVVVPINAVVDQTSDAPITRSSQRLLAITNGLSLRSGRALESRDDDSES